MRDIAIRLYSEAAAIALAKGIIIADTKFEFGLDDAGTLTLMDEVLTPDSSRFWPADGYAEGANPPSFDKQFVRDWLESVRIDGQPWNKKAPAPALPAEVVAQTAATYRAGRRAADAPESARLQRRSEQRHAQLAPVGIDDRIGRRRRHLAGDLERALLRRRGGRGGGAGAAWS